MIYESVFTSQIFLKTFAQFCMYYTKYLDLSEYI